jgi:AbrB family looped-hinge helix DNA binding protein
MSTYYKTRLRPKGQITLPGEIRELLELKEGDDLAFSVDEQGKVVVNRLDVIPPDQAWFWTERWQKMEREVEEDIAAGRIHHYNSVDEAIAALEGRAGARSRDK